MSSPGKLITWIQAGAPEGCEGGKGGMHVHAKKVGVAGSAVLQRSASSFPREAAASSPKSRRGRGGKGSETGDNVQHRPCCLYLLGLANIMPFPEQRPQDQKGLGKLSAKARGSPPASGVLQRGFQRAACSRCTNYIRSQRPAKNLRDILAL